MVILSACIDLPGVRTGISGARPDLAPAGCAEIEVGNRQTREGLCPDVGSIDGPADWTATAAQHHPWIAAADPPGAGTSAHHRLGVIPRLGYNHGLGRHRRSDPQRDCRCTSTQILRYRNKISGPLPDRIDIHVEVPRVRFQELASLDPGESSAAIRQRIVGARERQQRRFAGHPRIHCNADLAASDPRPT